MKRLTALMLAGVMLLCSCGGDKYGDALKAAKEKRDFTVKVESVMTVTTDEGTNEYKESVRFAQGGGIVSAKRTEDGSSYSEYYYFDGQIYYVSPEVGSYTWAADTEEFYAEFCYAAPLSLDMGKGEKTDGGTVYTATLDGADYKDTLLAINPYFDDFGIASSTFNGFTYTATVKDGDLISYGYDFTFDAVSGEQSAVIGNKVTVTYEAQADVVTMPEGYEGFINSGGNITDISEEAFTREVMLIIVEALYNGDGTRKDDFDETYAEFVAMYGEETMSTFIGGIEEFNASIGIEK